MKHLRGHRRGLAALAAVALAVSACGGDDDDAADTPVDTPADTAAPSADTTAPDADTTAPEPEAVCETALNEDNSVASLSELDFSGLEINVGSKDFVEQFVLGSLAIVALEEGGAMDYTTIVAAPASDPAGFKYLAPYTGSAIGQHWMYQGKHVLIVFDDLSKQAEAYRAVSLLLRRPPGREAYPGDVFYLHSRLLERCAKLSDDMGAGSMTGLPIIETKAGDVSAYIPTNVISITDGQIYLQADLFNSDVRPAIDVGVSVSRVGGAAQVKAMKSVSGRLKVDLAQFREMEAFAMFASDLDAASRAQLERGARMVELLKQPQSSPIPVEEQVAIIWAGTTGELDSVAVADVRRFEQEFIDYLRREHGDMLAGIRETGKLGDDTEATLNSAMVAFKEQFRASGDGGIQPGSDEDDENRDAMDVEDVNQEQIKRQKR